MYVHQKGKTMKKHTGLAMTALLAMGSAAQAETLAEIYELALKNDPTFQAAQATYLIGKEGLVSPRAALLPRVVDSASASYSIGGQHTEVSTEGFGTTTTRSEGGDQTYHINGLNYTFNVRNWFDFKSAEYTTEQTEAQFALDQQNLIVRVVGAYLNVLRAHEAMEIAQANQNESKRRLQNAKERFAVGLVSITDVHQAQATYDNAVVESLNREGDFAIQFEALELLTGQRHFEVSSLKEDFPVEMPNPVDREKWVDFALNNSNTLKVAQLGRDAAIEAAKGSKLNYTPTISVNINGYTINDAPGTTDTFFNPVTGLEQPITSPARRREMYGGGSVGISVPLFTWGENASERRVAAQRQVQAHENYVNARRNTVQDTRSSYLTAKTNAARVNALASAVTSAQSAYEATQAGYEVGTQNILDVLAEQTRLFTAQQNYANARYDYILSLLNLKLQAGQLNPEDVYTLDNWLAETPDIKKEKS